MGCKSPGGTPLSVRAFMARTMAQALDRSNCGIASSGEPQSKLLADGTDKLAQHSKVLCSVPEENALIAQPEFTSLVREICAPNTPAAGGRGRAGGSS